MALLQGVSCAILHRTRFEATGYHGNAKLFADFGPVVDTSCTLNPKVSAEALFDASSFALNNSEGGGMFHFHGWRSRKCRSEDCSSTDAG